MLIVHNVRLRYSTKQSLVLNNLSFSCETSGITALVGRSGVGKSTLIGLLAGIYTSDDQVIGEYRGEILLDDQKPANLRGPSVISWVPQHAVLMEHLSAMDNVLLPLSTRGITEEEKDLAASLLIKLEMEQFSSYRPRNLSGGMRARISLARALVSQPKYLFLDEPFAGLDLSSKWTVYGLIREQRLRQGLTTFITSHDIPETMLLCNRLVVLRAKEEGTVASIVEVKASSFSLGDPANGLLNARNCAIEIERTFFDDLNNSKTTVLE